MRGASGPRAGAPMRRSGIRPPSYLAQCLLQCPLRDKPRQSTRAYCNGPAHSLVSPCRSRRKQSRQRTSPTLLPWTSSSRPSAGLRHDRYAGAKRASRRPRPTRSSIVLSSDAISADAGYRSPRESKRRGPAIGESRDREPRRGSALLPRGRAYRVGDCCDGRRSESCQRASLGQRGWIANAIVRWARCSWPPRPRRFVVSLRLGLELLEHCGVIGGCPLLEDSALVIHHEDVEQLPDDLAPVGLQGTDR
jgi:hypothetical protein